MNVTRSIFPLAVSAIGANQKDKVETKEERNGNGKTIYKLVNGQLVSSEIYDNSGKLTTKCTYKYDNGKLKTWEETFFSGGKETGNSVTNYVDGKVKTKRTFDKNKRLVGEERVDGDTKYVTRVNYQGDKKESIERSKIVDGLLDSTERYAPDDTLQERGVFKYQGGTLRTATVYRPDNTKKFETEIAGPHSMTVTTYDTEGTRAFSGKAISTGAGNRILIESMHGSQGNTIDVSEKNLKAIIDDIDTPEKYHALEEIVNDNQFLIPANLKTEVKERGQELLAKITKKNPKPKGVSESQLPQVKKFLDDEIKGFSKETEVMTADEVKERLGPLAGKNQFVVLHTYRADTDPNKSHKFKVVTIKEVRGGRTPNIVCIDTSTVDNRVFQKYPELKEYQHKGLNGLPIYHEPKSSSGFTESIQSIMVLPE